MDFRERLQDLRHQHGFTQEQLADRIHISRAAVSKWESGRGFPNIEALKNLSRVFGVSVDHLLTGDELIQAAEGDHRALTTRLRTLTFGVFDALALASFFLPFLGQPEGDFIRAINWFQWTTDAWTKNVFAGVFLTLGLGGLVEVALSFRDESQAWPLHTTVSLVVHILAVLLFSATREPYLGAFFFVLLVAKGLVVLRRA